MKTKAVVLTTVTLLVLSTPSLRAGNIHAEAGGPRQRERAEREWAREPRETRERVEREMRDQAAERGRASEQARSASAKEQSRSKSAKQSSGTSSKQASATSAKQSKGDAPSTASAGIYEKDGKRIYFVEKRNQKGEVVKRTEWPEGKYSTPQEGSSKEAPQADKTNAAAAESQSEKEVTDSETDVPDSDQAVADAEKELSEKGLTKEEREVLEELHETVPPLEVDDPENDENREVPPPAE